MSLGFGLGGEVPNEGVNLNIQFNQDCTSLVMGCKTGYHLFELTPDDGIQENYSSCTGEEVVVIDRLYSSSLIAMVTITAPRKLVVRHYKKGTKICHFSYSTPILGIKLNRARLIVVLEESLHIHDMRNLAILHTINDTPPNPRGVCALSPCLDHSYIAYPGSSSVGEVQVYDSVHLNFRCVIPAHDSAVAALGWSSNGRMLATASERGTVIRVFAVPDRTRLFEFRRGMKRCVSISCLAFSSCGLYLVAASNTETVHVFRLIANEGGASQTIPGGVSGTGSAHALQHPPTPPPEDNTWMGWLTSAMKVTSDYLPGCVTDVLTQGRAFAAARLPCPAPRAVAAITEVQKQLRLVVATSHGMVHFFSIDTVEGGECTLLRSHNLLTLTNTSENTSLENQSELNKAPESNSYAGALRGRDPARMTESERECELSAAMEPEPPQGPYDLTDPQHFPPMRTPAAAAAAAAATGTPSGGAGAVLHTTPCAQ